MKKMLSISLKIALLFVFMTATYFSAWACGDKSKSKKEVQHAVSKCQKACCKKTYSNSKSNCENTCCKKHTSDTQKQKKGCCGDGDCDCAVSITVLADLPKLFILDISSPLPVFISKNDFFYTQAFVTSSVNDIWQPPIIILSI
jgi:hypothetical protein